MATLLASTLIRAGGCWADIVHMALVSGILVDQRRLGCKYDDDLSPETHWGQWPMRSQQCGLVTNERADMGSVSTLLGLVYRQLRPDNKLLAPLRAAIK